MFKRSRFLPALLLLTTSACSGVGSELDDLPVRTGPQTQTPSANLASGAEGSMAQSIQMADDATVAAPMIAAPVIAPTPVVASSASADEGVAAFRDICLANAPSFAGSAAAARAYDVDRVDDLGFMAMGMRADQGLSVQIKPGVECAITTPSRGANNPSAAFAAVVASKTSGSAPTSFPAVGTVAGTSYVFQHDRNGGEAFVMLKR